jgi:hypothetical protein
MALARWPPVSAGESQASPVREPGLDPVTPPGASAPMRRDAWFMAERPSPLPHLHDELAPTPEAPWALPDATSVHGVESHEAARVAARSAKP